MKHRIHELQARRQALLQRCEEQRLELAYRVARIKPVAQLAAWSRRGAAQGTGSHPLAWIAGLASLLLMFRRRKLVRSVGWLTGLLTLASRASTILRIIAQLRAVYLSVKAARKQPRD